MKYLKARLTEPSTWMGLLPAILTVLTSFHFLELTPEQYDALKNVVIVLLCGGLVTTKDSVHVPPDDS